MKITLPERHPHLAAYLQAVDVIPLRLSLCYSDSRLAVVTLSYWAMMSNIKFYLCVSPYPHTTVCSSCSQHFLLLQGHSEM